MNIFDHKFLNTAYADDTTSFLKNNNLVFEILNIFHKFSLVFGLKSNTRKCEIAGIGTLKEINVAPCGIKCLNLMKKTVKVIGVHFSYNET